MNNDETKSRVRVTVSGSFTKHWEKINEIREFARHQAELLGPLNGPPAIEDSGFVYLRGDWGDPNELEQRHLDAIRRSDLLYVVNPGGYLGMSVALEMGFALSRGVPIWTLEPITEVPHGSLVITGSIGEAIEAVATSASEAGLPEDSRLPILQSYIKDISLKRGFTDEDLPSVLILLIEELGELAKAMRSRMHLAMATTDRSDKTVAMELADCFIYILHFANQAGVDLFEAFRDKESLNASRKWTTN